MTFLLRYWKPLAAVAVILAIGLYAHRLGYESGYNSSEARWRPAFDAANTALVTANARTQRLEAESTLITAQSERQYAETIALLDSRAADADKRIRALSVRLATASPGRCELPQVSGATSVSDATSSSAERADRAGSSIADVGRRCEVDATTLAALQQWIRDQQALY